MPPAEEISEEGFGGFRGTWLIGRVTVSEAAETVRLEGEILKWLDEAAVDEEEFESLAVAIDHADKTGLPDDLLQRAMCHGLEEHLPTEDFAPLDGLEVGVAGLVAALSTIGCLTAASCRSHTGARSWSEEPVVIFAAPPWRVEVLADLVAAERCGVEQAGSLLAIYASSVADLHRLAGLILEERRRFRTIPAHLRSRPKRRSGEHHEQLGLFGED